MSALRKSLIKLDHVVSKLETSMSGLENELAGQQRDMFPEPSVPQAVASNDDGVDGALVVQALDRTINRVEKLLAEA